MPDARQLSTTKERTWSVPPDNSEITQRIRRENGNDHGEVPLRDAI